MARKVKVRNLYKSFGSLSVLEGLDLDVEEGEVVCMIGPSGSGKSTFLRCLNRLEEPTSGEIEINGRQISEKGIDINKIRENIGMVFQQFNLFPHLSVTENIMMAPVDLKKMTKEEAKR
ncbi:MAG TPA: ATP-binding cassette domain-containing protein, partial [Oscillospiraceae bacterium]|nr:ATP-binding cassette domain-containing protein [Oscillospiraceae bacterium]